MAKKRQRRCRNCRGLYHADSGNEWHQRYCGKPECRKASKQKSQRDWLNKPENLKYFKGPENVARVQQWRKEHPGYSKKKGSKSKRALQDFDLAQRSVSTGETGNLALQEVDRAINEDKQLAFLGIMAHLSGSALQDDIIKMCRSLIRKGQDIRNGSFAHDKERNIELSENSSGP